MSFNQHLSDLQDSSLSQGISSALCSMQDTIRLLAYNARFNTQLHPGNSVAGAVSNFISTRMSIYNSMQGDARLPKVTQPGKNWTLDNALASLRMHVAHLPEQQSKRLYSIGY